VPSRNQLMGGRAPGKLKSRGDGTPLRGAFIRLRRGFKNSLRQKLYQLCGNGEILVAIHMLARTPSGSAADLCSFYPKDTPPSPSDNKPTRYSTEYLQKMSNEV
jgi:hypothetical protein